MTQDESPPRTPWHLWLVAIVAVLWNSVGAIDIVATFANYEPYLKEMGGMSDADIAYFQSYPWWHNVLWALGTWGGFIGSILLLLRKRIAVPVLGASLFGAMVALGRVMFMDNVPAIAAGVVFPIIIWVIGAALIAYAVWMKRRGVLR